MPSERSGKRLAIGIVTGAGRFAMPAAASDDVAHRDRFRKEPGRPTGRETNAAKTRLKIDPVSGEEVQALVEKMYGLPPAVIKRAKDALVYNGGK